MMWLGEAALGDRTGHFASADKDDCRWSLSVWPKILFKLPPLRVEATDATSGLKGMRMQ